MPVSRKHGQYAVELFTDAMGAGPAVILGGQLRSAIRTGSDIRVESTDGHPYPVHQAIYSQEPTADLETYSVQAHLDQIGTQGLAIVGSTNPGARLFAYQRADGGSRTTGNTHRSYRIADGMALPVGLSCDHRGDASLTWRIDATYDGTNEPLVVANDVAVPTVANNNERFTLGPLSIGGTSFDHLTRAEISFGLNVTRESADSDIWPTHISIDDVIAMVRLTGMDAKWLDAAGIPFAGGKVTTHANGAVFFRRRDRSTVSQFAGGNTNISFTFDGLAVIQDALDASGQSAGTCSMEIPIVWDGTNAPIVYNSGVALP